MISTSMYSVLISFLSSSSTYPFVYSTIPPSYSLGSSHSTCPKLISLFFPHILHHHFYPKSASPSAFPVPDSNTTVSKYPIRNLTLFSPSLILSQSSKSLSFVCSPCYLLLNILQWFPNSSSASVSTPSNYFSYLSNFSKMQISSWHSSI